MPVLNPLSDPIGACLLDYANGKKAAQILTWSDVEGWDYLSAEKLCRTWKDMPEVEQHALMHCKGCVLDVGAGSGSHALWLQHKKMEVDAIDISPGAVRFMQKRGVKALLADFFELDKKKYYDTILLLMNGIGMCGDIPGFYRFLAQADKLLNVKGQILFDSADIIYMFSEGGTFIDLTKNYYGEVTYRMKYEDHRSKEFSWLFLAFEKLRESCRSAGWNAEIMFEGDQYEYLARLTRAD